MQVPAVVQVISRKSPDPPAHTGAAVSTVKDATNARRMRT